MNEVDEFFSEPITTLERAKKAFIYCGCKHYHMWHDYTKRYEEYKALNIPKSIEIEWIIEQFEQEFYSFNIGSEDGWYQYYELVEKAKMVNQLSHYKKILQLTQNIINDIPKDKIPHFLNVIIGNNASKTHGGLIEMSIKLNANDLVMEFINIAKELILNAKKCNVEVKIQEQYLSDISYKS